MRYLEFKAEQFYRDIWVLYRTRSGGLWTQLHAETLISEEAATKLRKGWERVNADLQKKRRKTA